MHPIYKNIMKILLGFYVALTLLYYNCTKNMRIYSALYIKKSFSNVGKNVKFYYTLTSWISFNSIFSKVYIFYLVF